jgi:hypothetical protein
MTSEADTALLERARSGDRGAIETILQEHEQRIYRFGLRMCGNQDDARDVLQETLLSAYRNLPTFRCRLSAFDVAVPGRPKLLHQAAAASRGRAGDVRRHRRGSGAARTERPLW